MSVSYDPIFGIGKYFDDQQEAKDWLCDRLGFYAQGFKEALENEWDGDLAEYFDKEIPELTGTIENCYSGDGYYIYMQVGGSNATEVATALLKKSVLWGQMFKEEPKVIHGVCIC